MFTFLYVEGLKLVQPKSFPYLEGSGSDIESLGVVSLPSANVIRADGSRRVDVRSCHPILFHLCSLV